VVCGLNEGCPDHDEFIFSLIPPLPARVLGRKFMVCLETKEWISILSNEDDLCESSRGDGL